MLLAFLLGALLHPLQRALSWLWSDGDRSGRAESDPGGDPASTAPPVGDELGDLVKTLARWLRDRADTVGLKTISATVQMSDGDALITVDEDRYIWYDFEGQVVNITELVS